VKIGPAAAAPRFAAVWADVAAIGMDRTRGGYSRHWFDDADMSLRAWFTEQAQARGLTVETDRNTNLWAWWGEPGPGAVATGSHLDSVPGGGTFDGILGVVAAFLAIDVLRLRGHQPRHPVAVVAFAEEEGGRFGSPCVGSRLLTGAADADQVCRLRDAAGWSVAEAAKHAGFDPYRFGPDWQRLGWIDSFVELHVEQGRAMRLLDGTPPVALGAQIGAHGRWRLTFTGQADHAGTTPASERRDPVVAAAATVLAARALMVEHAPAVATVGKLIAHPGATNVIAGSADVWLDARADTAPATSALVDSVAYAARQEAELEGCRVLIRRESFSDEVILDPMLGLELTTALEVPSITTGAGHDAGILASHVATAMLFVRNPTGISHSPAEYVDTADCLAGVAALTEALATLT
jgi:N-carbamoyl-L-amino-acid hydrolase